MFRRFLPVVMLSLCACAAPDRSGWDPVMVAYDDATVETVRLVERSGPPAALRRLREILQDDPALESLCHGLVHEIGHAAYEKHGFEGALAHEDDLCGSGYIHGIVETHLDRVRDIEAALPTICDPDAAKCFHGVGHGLMYKLDNDLPRSVELCGTYPKNFQRVQCAEGVFMETYDSETRFHASEYLKEDDPFFACRGLDPVNEGVCAFYATRYYLRVHPRAYEDALAWCMTDVPEGPRDACVKGVGDTAMKQNITDPLGVEILCTKVPEDKRRYCIEGMVSYAIVHAAKSSAGDALCPLLREEHRDACERATDQARAFYPE